MRLIGSLLWVLLSCFSVQAELLQILHTNDLHGHFSGLNDQEKRGGYAQLKQKITLLKASAQKQGVASLVLDAGDFSEGSLEYKAGDGFNTYKMMQIMGYDAIALGNHDYLMGPKRLEEILSEVELPLVAANIMMNPLTPASRKSIQHHRIIEKGNLKIAIVGGTTNEIFYKWLFRGNIFSDPVKAINREATIVRKQADVVIALTHIGVEADKILAEQSRNLDLIVGGHSHTKLEDVLWMKNKKKKSIPIVQTGEHAKFLGELLVDISPSGLKVLSYKLHPIFQDQVPDSEVEAYTKKTNEDVIFAYGDQYLNEVLGESEIPMTVAKVNGDFTQSFWTSFITKAMQDETTSDIAMNSLELFGIDQKPGVITRRKLISFYPRFFDLDRQDGWYIYTTEVQGLWLKMIINLARKQYQPVIFSGLKFELMPDESGELSAVNLNVNGIEIEPFKKYKIAMPEGIYRGMTVIIPGLSGRLLHNAENTKLTIVEAVARKVKEVKKVELNQVDAADFSFMPTQSR